MHPHLQLWRTLPPGYLGSQTRRPQGNPLNKIAHPKLKLLWAAGLFRDKAPSPELVAFLRKALDSKETARELKSMCGPDFEDFKERVIRAYERARQASVELVKERTINAFPEYSAEFDYTKERMVFAPGPLLYAVRPHKQQGELIIHDLEKGTTKRLAILQPQGFKAQDDFPSSFDNPLLSVNSCGDVFCRWDIKGNGDHGLALLKKGVDAFAVKRVNMYLADCLMLADRDGAWYLLQGAPRFTVYQIDEKLNLKRLGNFAGRGHHSVRIAEARFIANGLLHLIWADVLPEGNRLRLRCIDFDATRQKWLHNRELFRLDQFVSDASEPTVLQLTDESLHYLWRIDQDANKKRGDATGLYYQAEADGKTVKVSDGYEYRAIAVGNRIVVCYTVETSPEKVFFRIINHGVLGPVSEITAAKGRKDNLFTEYLLLYAESGRIWFVNTLARSTLYELKLTEAKTP